VVSSSAIARASLARAIWFRGGYLEHGDIWEHMMDHEWNDSQPIYRQLRDRVVDMILDGVLKEGDPLPSVRNVAAEYRVNHLTVLKGYQQLVDEQLVESKRGRGMFINAGARNLLLQGERQKFLAEQWPRVYATIQRLGLTTAELLDAVSRPSSSAAEQEPNA
jgi:GntR family transcriptional regulator